MENILPGFHKHVHSDDLDEYGRRVHQRSGYGPGYGAGPYEYTGQPVGFEHLGSPPKQRLEDMDARTIAQLGYEGPEGERRKVEAINEQIYERDYQREGGRDGRSYSAPIRGEGYEYREGYSDGYGRDSRDSRDRYRTGHSSHIPHYGGGSSGRRERESEEEYRRRRGGVGAVDRYGRPVVPVVPVGGAGYVVPVVPIPVTVDRKFEEDGTVVERIFPDNTATAVFSKPDHQKIHYGRQDSFPETALQEAVDSYRYPAGYSRERPPPAGYAPPFNPATSTYGRRPAYEGSSSDYVDPRYRQY